MTEEGSDLARPRDAGGRAHIVLCGLRDLGFRTLEELRRLDEHVVVIAEDPPAAFARRATALGARLVEGSYRDESVLHAAGAQSANAIVITEDDDVGNVHAALAAQDLNPHVRIVLRMFNVELGERVASLLHDCTVLDPAAIAAPAFVAAALREDAQAPIRVLGRTFTVRECRSADDPGAIALARPDNEGRIALFPERADGATCLVETDEPADPSQGVARRGVAARTPPWRLAWVALVNADRRLRYLGAAVLLLALSSVVVFSVYAGLDLVDAIYFTVTIITTTGFGDINLRDAAPALTLYGVALMLLGAAALAIFFALLTDAIVGARLAHHLGTVPRELRDHVVVCGIGNVGYRVVEAIARAGVPVAAAESNPDARFLPAVRRLGIPVMVADVRLVETLRALNVDVARSVVVATNDDLANLETALNARALHPNVRVVLRLFDHDLARRVERAFGIRISRSMSALAAPAFAAAAEGRRVLASVPIGPTALVVAQLRADERSQADGATVRAFESDVEGRVLAVVTRRGEEWRPAGENVIERGSDLIVIASRGGLADFTARAAPTREGDPARVAAAGA